MVFYSTNTTLTTGTSIITNAWTANVSSVTTTGDLYNSYVTNGITTTTATTTNALHTPYSYVDTFPSYRIRTFDSWGTYASSEVVFNWTELVKTPIEKIKEILNNRMSPNIISRHKPLGCTLDIREMRARETLRRVIGEIKFRDFVKKGSISVRAKSGLMYQIYPGSDFTKVYNRCILVARLCVVLLGGFPPTDSLIMRYLMILNNEDQFRSHAVSHIVGTVWKDSPIEQDNRSLSDIFKELKKVA